MKMPRISVMIGADTRKLKRDMKNADGIIGKFTSSAKLGLASAAAAAGAFAFKLGKDGVQAAIEDQASVNRLAGALDRVTKATDAQIAAVEDYISVTQMRYGIDDVLLRNSLNKLATVTGSVTKAQKMQSVALDVAAGSGISLEAATNLVTKALQGSFMGFKKLGVVLDENITKNKDGAAAVEVLGKKYAGAADKAAATTEGKLKILQQKWDDLVEKVGYALLPALTDLADWATSPEGAATLQTFVDDFSMAVKELPGAIDKVGKALDDITPDPNSPLWTLLNALTVASPLRMAGVGFNMYDQANQEKQRRGQSFADRYPNVNITINGAVDPGATGRQVQKILNQTDLNAVSPNAGDRRR